MKQNVEQGIRDILKKAYNDIGDVQLVNNTPVEAALARVEIKEAVYNAVVKTANLINSAYESGDDG